MNFLIGELKYFEEETKKLKTSAISLVDKLSLKEIKEA